MQKQFTLLVVISAVMLFSCNTQPEKPVEEPGKLVFRFALDSTGNITSDEVKQKLIQLAKDISRNADRVTLNAYSEQTDSKEKNEQIAGDMAYAAKQLMLLNAERAYYNVGVVVKGYVDPVDPENPSSLQNRRIEFVYVKP